MKSAFARGGALALAAAVAFGVSTPLVQKLRAHVGPFATAAAFQKLFIPSDATDQRAEDIKKFMTTYER